MAPTPLVTLVATGEFATVRTGAFDISVGQKGVCLWVIRDLDLLFVNVVGFDPRFDQVGGHRPVGLVVRVAILVELNVELRECRLVLLVILQCKRTRLDPFLGSVDRDRCPVHVRARDERCLLPDSTERPSVEIAGDVAPEVAHVKSAVGVRQPTGHHRWPVSRQWLVTHTG